MDKEAYNELKEEYKEHFKEIKELKKRLADVQQRQAMKKRTTPLQTDSLLASFDHLVRHVKEQAAVSEAKMELALEQLDDDHDREEMELRKREEKAHKTLEEMKQQMEEAQREMGSATEKPRDEIKKTIGRNQ